MTKKVAITGYSFRFPGQNDANLWQNLLNGEDLVTEVDPERWATETFRHPNKKQPGHSYSFAAGSIGDASLFDAQFFGISPREAASMDPQQRLLLELSWEALENSGIRPSAIRGSNSGVYIGISSSDYAFGLLDDLAAIDSSVATGTTASIAANRISYVFDLRGPSMAIDTACSSSMVAFHQACRSIISGESDLALAGGVSLHLHPYSFIIFSKATMLSERGRCNVFDASGDGYVRSEGGGIFVLKDYDQAVADGDPILAVVAASAINTDGHKTGITVPSSEAQAALLKQTYDRAGIPPESIDYIEAHGTGTAVGDPIETQAIGDALAKRRPKERPLPIGSVKSNLGHLEPASGVAGLVKALLCIQHRTVPATIGIKKPNPKIKLDDWNLEVVTQNRALDKKKKLIIGINSFGFGGANAHVILESHDTPKAVGQYQGALPPLILSAKSANALADLAQSYYPLLQNQSADEYCDLAYRAVFNRDWHEHRAIISGESTEDITKMLLDFTENPDAPIESCIASATPHGAVFIYSGNGSQWFGMGKRLLEDAVFKESIREVDALFKQYADYSLESELSGLNGNDRFEYTEIAQPALFALQVGITNMLRQRGIQPTAVAGHSVGEVAAAWAAGALTLADAVQVIYHRSRSQGTTKGNGQMTAVALDESAVQTLLEKLGLDGSLVIAGVNSSRGVTVTGDAKALDRLESALSGQDVRHKRLDLDYAFHSPAMDAIQADVVAVLESLQPKAAAIPFYSTVTGEQLEGSELDGTYWWHNIRKPVLFKQAINSIIGQGNNIFIEIGPHAVLSGYINDSLRDCDIDGRVIATVNRDDDQPQRVWSAANQAVITGANIDWAQIFPSSASFTHLPNYPWQRERHWVQATSESLGLIDRRNVHPLLGYALKQQELTWENRIDTQRPSMLADHVVDKSAIFPGTGYAELALAAAKAWLPEETVADIEELEILLPLILNEQLAKEIRLSINPKDGSFHVMGREYTGSEPWTLHAKGRIMVEPHDLPLLLNAPLVPTRQPDFVASGHETLTHAVGLDYGPAFQCIDHGWVDGNNALAILKIPDVIVSDLEQMHLHPAILDCTFQLILQLLRDELDVPQGIVFVPSKIGRITFCANMGRPHLVHAKMLHRAPHSLTAEFVIFDVDGDPIAVIKEARFRGVRLKKSAADHLSFLSYYGRPKPYPFTSSAFASLGFDTIQAAISDMVKRNLFQGPNHRYMEEVEPLLDSLCSQFVIEAFQQLATNGKRISRDAILARRKKIPEIALFLDHLLDWTEEYQALSACGQEKDLQLDQENQTSAQEIWNILVADYPDFFPIIHTVGRVGTNLCSILKGDLTVSELLSENVALSIPITQVLGANRKQKVGQAIRDLIGLGLSQLPEGRRFALMEVSYEAPLFTMDACLSMDFERCDYTFATPSAEAQEDFARLQEYYPDLRSQLIAQESEQESSPRADLAHFIIVTLDFNETLQALKALEFAKSQLAPGGTLLLTGQHPSCWIDFAFGGHPGWFSESEGSRLSTQRPINFWQQQLLQLGLICGDPLELSPGGLSDIFFLLARREEADVVLPPPKVEHRQSWMILADKNDTSSKLAEQLQVQLQASGDQVLKIFVEEVKDYDFLLMETAEKQGNLDGIINLAGLKSPTHEIEATECVNHQVDRCTTAADLMRACENTQTNTTCWMITAGAAGDLLPTDGRPAQKLISPDSAFWGFCRSLMNESSNFNVCLIDLEMPVVEKPLILAIAREFEQRGEEQEVILTATGERFVPRMRLEPSEQPDANFCSAESSGDTNVCLGFQFPGQLRNLRWESAPCAAIDDDEVEIEVHATGLNFRDLMYAMGLLSDEAVENGFAGPTLGLEFAGTVQRIGSKSVGFSVGDKVVGFGPSSFSQRVVTKTSAISHIPPSLSFEAAATIPSVFFTVYYALHHLARLQEGEKVLIHGAAGGIGIAAIQLAKSMGAEVYATAGSDEKRDFLDLLGADHIFDSRSLAFADEILAQTDGKGIDVVLNSLAGEAINRNFQVLKPFGRFLELGKRDFYENTKVGLRPFRNNISYFGIDADQLMLECPELTGRLFSEVMALFAEGALNPLPYHVFEAENIIDAFRYMQQARHIGKIVVTYRNGINHVYQPIQHNQQKLELSADGAYLVTGGLGGFGLKTAEWLAEKGARYLVLISRSGPTSDEAKQAIQRLKQQGVDVLAESCDVTDQKALEGLLTKISYACPPLRGVVHAATVIDDSLVYNMDSEQIRRVLNPKILGAQYLHQMTLDKPLDFFILFSSATTLFGNSGQANYVAANSWLEALASNRRAMGLPATCVRWGAIDDAGFLARNEKIKDALQSRMGGGAINSGVALETLENLLLTNRSGLGVLELDWSVLARSLPTAGTPKFSEVARGAADGKDHNRDSIEDIQHLLTELPEAELAELFIGMIKSDVGEVLRIAPEKIDPTRSIHEMGLDSLMGVELVTTLEDRFGIRLPVMALRESSTITKLAMVIIDQLKGHEDTDTPDESDNMRNQIQNLSEQHGVDTKLDDANDLVFQLQNDNEKENNTIII